MNKGIILFLEGETEKAFYDRVIDQMRQYCGTFDCHVIIKNIKGVGNYKNKVKRIFQNDILRKNKGVSFTVFLCHDTDVFEMEDHPPVQWKPVEQELRRMGVRNIFHIAAESCIEDWFLSDTAGILRFLRLPQGTTVLGTGADAIQRLFKKRSRVYIKGGKTEGLIDALDIRKIMDCHCDQLNTLCRELNIICEKHHHKCCQGNQ